MKIYAPVKDTNGIYASVRFVNGVGETDNPHLLEWFKSQGYALEDTFTVEKCVETHENSIEKCVEEQVEKPEEPDFESMSPYELREWMKENGFGLKMKNIRNKEKLLEIIRG